MSEYIRIYWPIAVSVILTLITFGMYKTKIIDLIEKDKKREKDIEELKVQTSNHHLEIDHLKERDKEFINALDRNTEALNELKIAVAVNSSNKNG